MVFGTQGYFQASISDIVREAGVAQGTFYVYFESKRDVFVDLVRSLANTVREALAAAVARAKDRIEQEEIGFAAFFSVVRQHPHLYRIVRQAEFVDPPTFREYYETFLPGYARGLRSAMDKGSVRRMDPETLAYCLMGIGDFVGMRWPYWTEKPVPPKVFETMMKFIRLGIDAREPSAPAGRRKSGSFPAPSSSTRRAST